MPWRKNYDETRVLERAMYAFWSRGYEATSMNDLVAATGINRGSIYAAFTNKHALFMSALKHYDQVYRNDHLARLAAAHSPRQAIFATFAAAAEKPTANKVPWGCLLVNTALEMSPHDPEIAAFIDKTLREVEAFFFSRITAAQADSSISPGLDPRKTAQALLGLFLGLRVLTRVNSRQSTLDAVISQAKLMLT